MGLTVKVVSAGDVPEDLAAVGVPVLARSSGPELPEGLVRSVGGVDLPLRLPDEMLRRQGFTAKVGQSIALRAVTDGPALVLLGLGGPVGLDPERWRRAAAELVRAAGEGGTAAMVVPETAPDADPVEVGAAVAEGAALGAYRFESYRSTPRPSVLDALLVVPSDQGTGDGAVAAGAVAAGAVAVDWSDKLAAGARRGVRAAEAVAFARDLVNTPPSDLPPSRLAERVAKELEGTTGTTVEVWDEERIKSERLGGLLGVSRGSLEPPRLVRAVYDPVDPIMIDGRTPHVVLVGKGITFDSGGLSLKTAEGMSTMKTDMSGAAIVLAALSACADLGVRVKVTALAPITENMPGARAVKPGDVLTIRNGSTIEVLNTDAEGRLVLADALSLAAEIDPAPDAIVDVATLTGAAVVALGMGIAAIFGSDEPLVERVRRSGDQVGERLWPMPLPEEYADHIESEVADMKNTGRPGQAGSIAAALLLARFTGGLPWAHLDIAGPARSPEDSGYLSKGGTAFGVRTLLALLASYG